MPEGHVPKPYLSTWILETVCTFQDRSRELLLQTVINYSGVMVKIRAYILMVWMMLFQMQATLGKPVLFRKADFGYHLESIQDFLLKMHQRVPEARCAFLCFWTPSCGSLVYIRSSKSCMLVKSTYIPASAITARNNAAQVWIPGKFVM